MLKTLGWLVAIPAVILAQDARTVVANAGKAMGAETLKTLQNSGMGSNAGIGQNINPKAAWPVARVKAYSGELDFSAIASHVRMTRVQGGVDQDLNRYVLNDSPWEDQFEFWLNPFGFLKGASANTATVRSETIDGAKYNVVTFTLQNKYKVSGYINDQNLIEKVQTWIDNDVLGDMVAEASYSVYKDFGGVKFPTMIIEKQGGFPVLIMSVSDVKPNATVNIQPPRPHTEAAAAPAVSVQSEKIADGVFYLKGGTHHSVAVEFVDHVAVIEAPLNEQRSLAVIAEVKKLIPNKPIRYVINTHHHFDHSGGLRAYVDEGATIITQDINKEFYEKAFSTPRTIHPDRLAQSGKIAKIEIVGDKKILGDGARTLELHLIKSSPHNDGILMAFLPKEKILIEVDVFTPPSPPAAGAPPSAPAAAVNPSTVNLVDNVEKLKLDFVTILPLHGPGVATRADLYAAIRKPVPDINQILTAVPPAAPGRGRGGAGGAAGGGAQASAAPAAAAADPARLILETACTSCHALNRVQSQKLSKAEWQGIVDKMKGRGAEVSDDDTIALVDYLAKTYAAK
jgi:glyoxylase-like metal-dependent hydrolase (beta-lactamase superfamily II)